MKRFIPFLLVVLFFAPVYSLFAQTESNPSVEELFSTSGELYFTFQVGSSAEIELLTRMISIDNVIGTKVFAYANKAEFARFLEMGYPYAILPHPGTLLSREELRPAGAGMGPTTIWNYYPTYDEYIGFMNDFAASYPDICKLVPIGTSIQGRSLVAVKISDNVNEEEAEPEFLYTSSIHGDEVTGYILMLHLIDYLLTNYGVDPRITDMVDHTEIFINPLANPDGTYYGGNSSVYEAKRYNANYIDLNRNYPDPEDGLHPDGNAWQVETVAFMAFADSNHIAMSANFHGGAEVFNYPWDTWAKLAADDAWWQFVGREYADTVHLHSPSSYFTFLNNGITNGYQWYTISGGRQDYMNYWHGCREVTIEISNIKMPPASQLLSFWEYNYRSLLNFIEEANYGIQGIVTDSVTGEPLQAGIFIQGHDIDHSDVSSKLPTGYYSRFLYEGTYSLTFTSTGYFPKTIEVSVTNRETTRLDVEMVPLNVLQSEPHAEQLTMVFPNPSNGMINLIIPEKGKDQAMVTCYDLQGKEVYSKQLDLQGTASSVKLNLGSLAPGLYLLRFSTGGSSFTDRIIIR